MKEQLHNKEVLDVTLDGDAPIALAILNLNALQADVQDFVLQGSDR